MSKNGPKMWLVVVVVCFATTPARAYSVIFDSIDPTSNQGAYIDAYPSGGAYGPLADSFSTGSQGVVLNELKLRLVFIGPYIPTIVHVDLTDNNSTSTTPGATLVHIGDIDASKYNQEYAVIDFSNIAYQLAAQHRYWIELSTALHGPAWTLAFAPFSTSVANEFIYEGVPGRSYANSRAGAAVFQMQVSASATAAVPEPSSAVLAVMGGVTATVAALKRSLCRRSLQI